MRKMSVWLSLLLLLATVPGWAAFEELGGGARPLGMGEAFVATADSGDALRYNVAGLGMLEQPGVSFTQSRPFAGLVVENYLTGVFPVAGFSSLGLSYTQLSEDNGVYKERSLTFGLARRWGGRIGTGVQLKYFSTVLDETNLSVKENPYFEAGTSASAISLDVGLLLSDLGGFQVGLALSNLVPADLGIQEEDTLPVEARFGFAYEFAEVAASAQQPALQKVLESTRVGVQLSLSEVGRGVHVGAESWLSDGLALRAGYISRANVHSAGQLTIGASIRPFDPLQLDYAFQWLTADLSDNTGHRISTTLVF